MGKEKMESRYFKCRIFGRAGYATEFYSHYMSHSPGVFLSPFFDFGKELG